MAVIDDFKAALAAEDTVIDQAVAYVNGVPALVQSAVDLAKAGNDADLTTLMADVKAHSDALSAALGVGNVTSTTPAAPAP